MTDRGRVYRPGEDPLAPRYMTPEQVAALVERVREAESSVTHRGAMLASAHRWSSGGRGKLTSGAVVAIRQERGGGTKLQALAALYGVSEATISRAVRR